MGERLVLTTHHSMVSHQFDNWISKIIQNSYCVEIVEFFASGDSQNKGHILITETRPALGALSVLAAAIVYANDNPNAPNTTTVPPKTNATPATGSSP